jgi:hypothetical protein
MWGRGPALYKHNYYYSFRRFIKTSESGMPRDVLSPSSFDTMLAGPLSWHNFNCLGNRKVLFADSLQAHDEICGK